MALILGCLRASSGCADVLSDAENADHWPGYGRTYHATRYSPLTDVNASNVSQLGLAWWFDIPGIVMTASTPLEVGGKVYFATGYSVVRAVDAATGRLLWTYDPEVAEAAGHKLRIFWGIRGFAFWNDKVYVGTHDGRLISIDANTGKRVWSVVTTEAGDTRIITGPPLVFDGKVMIGHAGDLSTSRCYVTAYDAESGRQLWRFFTVPGDPKRGFENKAMEMAAKTWKGQWWKFSGGGGVWNAMTYDPELKRVYIGTGNGVPYNQKIRSPGGGDNLFVSSIVALDAETGTYVWHYQTNPGDTWDYDATEDLELATMEIEGKPRRVLMQASKNGFFYVIDRDSGKLISAQKFAKVTWAQGIDLKTGRPAEAPNARYQSGETTLWPGPNGAHGIPPMAFNPTRSLVYIPVMDVLASFIDKDVDLKAWKPNPASPVDLGVRDFGVRMNFFNDPGDAPAATRSSLLAWDPIQQRATWRVALPGIVNGGVATTAGNLVFQGRSDGKFVAYAADSGKEIWSFDAQVGIYGSPITYKVGNRQYVSVLAGYGGGGAQLSPVARWGDVRTQPRRLLTFVLDGRARLPAAQSPNVVAVSDPTFTPNAAAEQRGAATSVHCAFCHGGYEAAAGGTAPDLRTSPMILSADAFRGVVKQGGLLKQGMPRFEEFTDAEVEDLRQFLRSRAADLAKSTAARSH
jgi:quinohemoprotein ethanol dehydrogenase